WGYPFTLTSDGNSALEALQLAQEEQRPYSIIFMGKCPHSDSCREVIKTIHARYGPATKIILMSSPQALLTHGLEPDPNVALSIGKPVRYEHLKQAILSLASGISPKKEAIIRLKETAEKKYRGAGLRVMVVEDNIVNQKVAMGILANLGIRVDVTANGKEALTALKSMPYDLVLMDCQMPVMDGFEATKNLRADPLFRENQGIPVIAMTANAMQGDRERCIAAGMNDYIPKPVTPKTLIAMLDSWLSERLLRKKRSRETGPYIIEEREAFVPENLLSRMMGDEKLALLVLESFTIDFPNHINSLRDALHKGSAPLQSRILTLKGASADISSPLMEQAIENLETTAATRNTVLIQVAITALEATFKKFVLAIAAWKPLNGSPG
ncbi:response regulator, partial [Myxococcota bacterium]|nr:response regulator [Myxococcota bacterium]